MFEEVSNSTLLIIILYYLNQNMTQDFLLSCNQLSLYAVLCTLHWTMCFQYCLMLLWAVFRRIIRFMTPDSFLFLKTSQSKWSRTELTDLHYQLLPHFTKVYIVMIPSSFSTAYSLTTRGIVKVKFKNCNYVCLCEIQEMEQREKCPGANPPSWAPHLNHSTGNHIFCYIIHPVSE